MITLYDYNIQHNLDLHIKLSLENTTLKIYLTINKLLQNGESDVLTGDAQLELKSYRSYSIRIFNMFTGKANDPVSVRADNIITIAEADRICMPSRMPYNFVNLFYGSSLGFQISTGIINNDIIDFNIASWSVPLNKFDITELGDITIAPGSEGRDEDSHPRWMIWDNYALNLDYNENVESPIYHKFDHNGIVLENPNMEINVLDKEYITMSIQKYDTSFTTPLVRDIDNEVCLVEVTGGIINTQRVYLKNGFGTFRYYPLGYRGPIKLKVGWRWYPVLNEYPILVMD